MSGDPRFLQALDDLRALHLSKGHDYADTTDPLKNYVQSAYDGGVEPWRAAWIRLSEKYHRFVNLTRKGDAPNHESLDDTLMDLAAMALIVRSLRARGANCSILAFMEEQAGLRERSLKHETKQNVNTGAEVLTFGDAPIMGTVMPNGTIMPNSGMSEECIHTSDDDEACQCAGCTMYHAAVCSAQGDGDGS